ncbi:FAD-binding protein [Candidatus Bathyarchaeota archaeon]|nr:FAD-binding protein [Candidatus Bathyarchaeota archaeon]
MRKRNTQAMQEFLADLKGASFHRFSTRIEDRIATSGDLSGIPCFHWRWKTRDLPEVIAWPESTGDLQLILDHASTHGIPVTPRGAGCNYTGSSVASSGGIVLDLKRLKHRFEIDVRQKRVTASAGFSIGSIRALAHQHGMDLPMFPTSFHVSTFGGWCASSPGIGYGSFIHGTMQEALISVEVVRPNGITEELKNGAEIHSIAGCEGTTGIISSISMNLVNHHDHSSMILSIPSGEIASVLAMLFKINSKGSSIHTVHLSRVPSIGTCENGLSCQLRVITMERQEQCKVREYLEGITPKTPMRMQGESIFNPDARSSPFSRELQGLSCKNGSQVNIVDVYLVKTDEIPNIMKKIDELAGKINAPLPRLDLMLSLDGRARLTVSCTAHPTRWSKFLMMLGLMHRIKKTMHEIGAGNYTQGLLNVPYFKKYRKEQWKACLEMQRDFDPNGIMNPLKRTTSIISHARLNVMLGLNFRLASLRTSFRRALGISGKTKLVEGTEPIEQALSLGEIPERKHLQKCSFCTACKDACPVYNLEQSEARSPAGIMRNLLSNIIEGTPKLYQLSHVLEWCTTCLACREACPFNVPMVNLIEGARYLTQDDLNSGRDSRINFIEKIATVGNPYGEESSGFPDKVENGTCGDRKNPNGFFLGCTLTHRAQECATNCINLLNKALVVSPVIFGAGNECCMGPAIRTGQLECRSRAVTNPRQKSFQVNDAIKKIMNRVASKGITTMITSCPGCLLTMEERWKEIAGNTFPFTSRHLTEILLEGIRNEKIDFKQVKMKVTYHDPCHLGRGVGIYEQPREILNAIPGITLLEMEHHHHDARCCGAGGGFRVSHPIESIKLGKQRLLEAIKTGADALVTACPFCRNQFIKVKEELRQDGQEINLDVLNIEELAWEALDKGED